jgi:DNA polymerase-4/DNA polymerase V
MRADKVRDLYEAVDEMREKFGKHCLHLGAAHLIDKFGKGRRGTPTVREQTTFYGETKRKHLPLPVLHIKI